jgi:hypothetical protein
MGIITVTVYGYFVLVVVVVFNDDDDDDDDDAAMDGKRNKSVHIESKNKYSCFISKVIPVVAAILVEEVALMVVTVLSSDVGTLFVVVVDDGGCSNDVMIIVYCDTCLRNVALVRMDCMTVAFMVVVFVVVVTQS